MWSSSHFSLWTALSSFACFSDGHPIFCTFNCYFYFDLRVLLRSNSNLHIRKVCSPRSHIKHGNGWFMKRHVFQLKFQPTSLLHNDASRRSKSGSCLDENECIFKEVFRVVQHENWCIWPGTIQWKYSRRWTDVGLMVGQDRNVDAICFDKMLHQKLPRCQFSTLTTLKYLCINHGFWRIKTVPALNMYKYIYKLSRRYLIRGDIVTFGDVLEYICTGDDVVKMTEDVS